MSFVRKLALAASLMLSIGVAHAEYVKTDWQEEGDKLALLDEGTGIEWLSLTETVKMSINEVQALLETTYAGWRLPIAEEVEEFIAGIFNLDSLSSSTDNTVWELSGAGWDNKASSFYSLMGKNLSNGGYSYNYGIHVDGDHVLMSGTRSDNTSTSKVYIYDGYENGYTYDYSRSSTGVFLVSDGGTTLSSQLDPTLNINNANAPINNVPVVFVSGFAVLGLAFTRRRKQ